MKRSTQKMVGFLRLCQHFARKKREMESRAADIKRPPTGRGQVVVRSSSDKSRRPPPKVDQSVQCSPAQQSVRQSVQESVKDGGRVDVSEEEERELEKRLLKLQELLGECDDDDEGESESEDNFDVEIASALRGVDRELEERRRRAKLTDLVVVSSETAAVFTVDVALITDRLGTKCTSTGKFSFCLAI